MNYDLKKSRAGWRDLCHIFFPVVPYRLDCLLQTLFSYFVFMNKKIWNTIKPGGISLVYLNLLSCLLQNK